MESRSLLGTVVNVIVLKVLFEYKLQLRSYQNCRGGGRSGSSGVGGSGGGGVGK